MYVYVYVYVYVYMNVYIYIYSCTYVCVYIYIIQWYNSLKPQPIINRGYTLLGQQSLECFTTRSSLPSAQLVTVYTFSSSQHHEEPVHCTVAYDHFSNRIFTLSGWTPLILKQIHHDSSSYFVPQEIPILKISIPSLWIRKSWVMGWYS